MADNLDNFARELDDVGVELTRVQDLAKGVGNSMASALKGAIADGKSLKSVLGDISKAFADLALRAALKPVATLISGAVENLFKATDPPLIKKFAAGGVVNAPSYFPTRTGMALAGEAGPEAIMPLTRGADGRLGVAGASSSVNVTLNVTASDARSFAASEAEISAMLLRAVKRGTRAS